MIEATRNAAATGIFLVIIAVGLLASLVVVKPAGTDLMAAFALAAGYLLHAGVSLIRSAF